MQKIFRHWIMPLMAAALTIGGNVACSDDDDNEPNPNEEVDEASERIKQQLVRESIINALAEKQTLGNGTINYIPRIGEAIKKNMPTVYYVGVDSLGDALWTWENQIVTNTRFTSGEENELMAITRAPNEKVTEVKLDNLYLKFELGDAPDVVARIKVDVDVLKNVLTEIVFIPRSAWPTNDYATPFLRGSLWREKSTGRFYICVAECYDGNVGYLMTFDGGWTENKFSENDYWQGKFIIYDNCAVDGAWKGMASLLAYQKERVKRMMDRFYVTDSTAYTYKTLKNALYNPAAPKYTNGMILGGNRGSCKWDTGLWWAHYNYYVTVYRASVYPDGRCELWDSYYEHKQTPCNFWLPSHSIQFSYDFNPAAKGFEPIFK